MRPLAREGKPWTPREVDTIRSYAAQGLSQSQAATLQGRSKGAIGAVACKQRIKFRGKTHPRGFCRRQQ